MTSDKAQKRAVRARMAKTGERFTTARRHHLGLHRAEPIDTPGAESPAPALPPRVAEPSMSDEALRRGTGKAWDDWFLLLDAWGAAGRTHPEIARHLAEEHGLNGWWAQGVTVGYERARGLRAPHERPDGFSVNASKTFPVPVERLFAAFVEEAQRDGWLESGTLRLRTAQPNRSARFDVVANGTRLHAYFLAKGEAKATAQLQHEKLPAREEVDTLRAFWKDRLARLAEVLASAE